jgi:glycosyltransferase involved in cell wall biosynthesis
MSRPTIAPVAGDDRPLWSVMIPVYRPSIEWLRETISGVLGAGLGGRNLQLALVDDANGQVREGDADGFWRECEARGIEIHRFADKAGLPGNWNRCLQLSRGHFIHILHQDDHVRPEFYRTMATALEANPRAGASFSQHLFIASDGTTIRTGHLDRPKPGLLDDWLEFIIANLAIQCPAIVVRRAVYEKLGGFDDSYGYCPDYDMWQRIATEYPLWYDPLPLAEFRVHDDSESSSTLRRLTPWLEVNRCRAAGVARISPPARHPVARSARRHTVRLAIGDAIAAIGNRDWRRGVAAFAGAAVNGRLSDWVAVATGRYDVAPGSRPPPRPENIGARRLPRILLLTEFFPANPARCVFGAYQRLGRHIEALAQVGPVDAVFFWPKYGASSEQLIERADMVRKLWPIEGQVRFIDASTMRRGPLRWISDMFWGLRGAVGFYHTAATMRTSGRDQAAALHRCLQDLQPDLIFAHRLGAAAPLLRARTPLPPVVIDVDDLEHIKLERLAASMPRSWRKMKTLAEAWLARHALRRIGSLAASLLVASELDRSELKTVCRAASIAVIPNTAARFDALPRAISPVALFVGTAAYPPNREAIIWLIREIWPLVREKIPNARLLLAGEGTEQLVAEGSVDGIEGLGFVADLASAYQRAAIAVCPVRRGSGTRIKIIEAAMNGRPVVSTFIGAEGLLFAPDTEIMLDDDPSGFARACVKLMLDPDLAAMIAAAALKRADADYRSEQVSERLAALCTGLANGHGAEAAPGKQSAAIEIGQPPLRRRENR